MGGAERMVCKWDWEVESENFLYKVCSLVCQRSATVDNNVRCSLFIRRFVIITHLFGACYCGNSKTRQRNTSNVLGVKRRSIGDMQCYRDGNPRQPERSLDCASNENNRLTQPHVGGFPLALGKKIGHKINVFTAIITGNE